MNATERFLKYVAYDTASEPESEQMPSTQKQFALANALADEMRQMGVSGVRVDEHAYVYGFLPETVKNLPALGFVAHMDTSPDAPGANVKPRIEKNYGGGDILLSESAVLSPERFPGLLNCIGQDLIVTDGNTLLGADDKAGIAEILTMAEYLIAHPEMKRGKICIGFTPDEEVGRGADLFDVEGFGADFAYTVDGGALGELEYENFNAANARVTAYGRGIHPGSAKNKMLNAMHVAMEFDSLLPAWQRPEHTEGYEGFFHLTQMAGEIEKAVLGYIVRDHDKNLFEQKKALMEQAAAYLNQKYGANTLKLEMRDSYYNMKEMILPHMHLIETASAAMRALGVEPEIVPVRGGTDGARLSYMGLPCPNLCTGGYNYHGRYEFIPVQSLEKITEILVKLVDLTYAAA
ncbi:MAG: peptidase T [Clostridiaceae bacterium]|nr:peptidase T [Eubacteriales bacterium]